MTDSGRYRLSVAARPIYAPELILVSSLGRWCCQRPRYLEIQRLDPVMVLRHGSASIPLFWLLNLAPTLALTPSRSALLAAMRAHPKTGNPITERYYVRRRAAPDPL